MRAISNLDCVDSGRACASRGRTDYTACRAPARVAGLQRFVIVSTAEVIGTLYSTFRQDVNLHANALEHNAQHGPSKHV